MQLTREIYSGLMRSAGYIILSLFVFVNALILFISNNENEHSLSAQSHYLKVILQASHGRILPNQVEHLSSNIIGWRVFKKDKLLYQSTNHLTELKAKRRQFTVIRNNEPLTVEIHHAAFFQHYFRRIMLTNGLLALVCLGGLAGTHRIVLKHWKAFIQIETWASRFSRDKDTKFFIKGNDCKG